MGYCSFWASWFHMNLYPWKGSGHSGALFKYTRQLYTHTHTYTRSQKDIHIQTIHALHTYIQPAKRKWCFLISSNTRNRSLSYSSTNQNHNMHARTRSNTHIFTRQSALLFSLWHPRPLFFLHLKAKKAHRHMHQINTYKITMVPVPGAGAHFVWSLCWWKENKVALAKPG